MQKQLERDAKQLQGDTKQPQRDATITRYKRTTSGQKITNRKDMHNNH